MDKYRSYGLLTFNDTMLQITPNYTSTFAFSNDFPALLENMGNVPYVDDPLFQSLPARGTCRVLCFHPDSKVTIPLMTENEIKNVIHLLVMCFLLEQF